MTESQFYILAQSYILCVSNQSPQDAFQSFGSPGPILGDLLCVLWKVFLYKKLLSFSCMNQEVIVTQHSDGQLSPSLPPLLCLCSTFPEHCFSTQMTVLLPTTTQNYFANEQEIPSAQVEGLRVGGKLVLLALSKRVASTWSKEHLIRLIISLKTILPETALSSNLPVSSIPGIPITSLVVMETDHTAS